MKTEPTDHPFQPGVEVALVNRHRWSDHTSYETAVVSKVHKNGNFVLVGNPQQYRASLWNMGEKTFWRGRATGYRSGSELSIEFITDDLRERARQSERGNQFKSLVRALDSMRNVKPNDAQIAALKAIVDGLTSKPQD